MLRRKSFLVVVLTLALLLPLVTQASAKNKTYLNVPPAAIITLAYDPGSGLFYKMLPSGEILTTPFAVASRSFILMDLDWTFTGPANSNATLRLIIQGQDTHPVFVTRALTDANGVGGTNVNLNSGVVFGQKGTTLAASFSDGVQTTGLLLHGYMGPK
jgi:hypothetical protein